LLNADCHSITVVPGLHRLFLDYCAGDEAVRPFYDAGCWNESWQARPALPAHWPELVRLMVEHGRHFTALSEERLNEQLATYRVVIVPEAAPVGSSTMKRPYSPPRRLWKRGTGIPCPWRSASDRAFRSCCNLPATPPIGEPYKLSSENSSIRPNSSRLSPRSSFST